MTPVWLSIDWDFFWRVDDDDAAWEGPYTESAFWREPMWTTRAAEFEAGGRNIRKEVALAEEPHEFWQRLADAGLKFEGVPLGIADAHKFALEFFTALPNRPASKRVLHFDAHHDLGYRGPVPSVEGTEIDSGNWLLHLMLRRKQAELRVLYPAWKGFREMDNPETKLGSLGTARGRVVPDILGAQTLATALPPQPVVEGIFIARSGSWTPPWGDPLFASFVADLEQRRKGPPAVRFDAQHEELDVLLPRYIDWTVVTRHAERLRARFEAPKP